MTNSKELREELVKVFNSVKCDGMELKKAKVLVSTSDSILKSVKLELDHNKLTGSKKEIDFLK